MIYRSTAARSYVDDGEDGPSIVIRFDYVDVDGRVQDVELDVTDHADTLLAQLARSVVDLNNARTMSSRKRQT